MEYLYCLFSPCYKTKRFGQDYYTQNILATNNLTEGWQTVGPGAIGHWSRGQEAQLVREGFTKKVAVLLDFVQISSTPPPPNIGQLVLPQVLPAFFNKIGFFVG